MGEVCRRGRAASLGRCLRERLGAALRGRRNRRPCSFTRSFASRPAPGPIYAALLLAGSEIFTPNYSMFPVIAALDSAGYRMGILSNTCPGHWSYCSDGRYGLIGLAFRVFALSYELGSLQAFTSRFSRRPRQLAGTRPERDFFHRRRRRARRRGAAGWLRRGAVHDHAGAGRRPASSRLEFNY